MWWQWDQWASSVCVSTASLAAAEFQRQAPPLPRLHSGQIHRNNNSPTSALLSTTWRNTTLRLTLQHTVLGGDADSFGVIFQELSTHKLLYFCTFCSEKFNLQRPFLTLGRQHLYLKNKCSSHVLKDFSKAFFRIYNS